MGAKLKTFGKYFLKFLIACAILSLGTWLILSGVSSITRGLRDTSEEESKRLLNNYNALAKDFNGLKVEYEKVVVEFNEAIRRTSVAYIYIGSVEKLKPITVKIRPYDNKSEKIVVPTLVKPTKDRSLCYKTSGDIPSICDSFLNNTLSPAECYPCEPIPRLLDPDGSMTVVDGSNVSSDRVLYIIGSIFQGHVFVSSLELHSGGVKENYTIDTLPAELGIIGQPTTSPAVLVTGLFPNTVYTIVVNAAGLFDLEALPPDKQKTLPDVRPLRTEYEEIAKNHIDVVADEEIRKSDSFLDKSPFCHFHGCK